MPRPNKFSSDILSEHMRNIPLEIRVKVGIEAHFLDSLGGSFLVPLNEDGEENEEAMEFNRMAFNAAKPIVDLVLEAIKEWKADGSPEN